MMAISMGIKMIMVLTSILLFFIIVVADIGASGQNKSECKEARCGENGPTIRFPFRLKASQPAHCGYPGFDLHCSAHPNYNTSMELPNIANGTKFFVRNISYQFQQIELYNPDKCWLQKHNTKSITLSFSPFDGFSDGTVLLNCSKTCSNTTSIRRERILCFGDSRYSFYVSNYWSDIDSILPELVRCKCRKIQDFPLVQQELFTSEAFYLRWSQPDCRDCQKNSSESNYDHNGTVDDDHNYTLAFDSVISQIKGGHRRSIPAKVQVSTCVIIGTFVLIIVVGISYHVYNLDKKDRESRLKIKKFLEDYNSFKPSRYSYYDIKKITDQFKEKLGQGAHGIVFKGKLSKDIFVAVKILNNSTGNGDDFINEVATMGQIHHVNVVRLVGFCAERFHKALIYEFLPNDSLEKYISHAQSSNSSNTNSLSWETIYNIALGIAKGIEYLHQGCDQRILHFDIKPHNVLLDRNFTPKISDFGLAKLCSKDQSAVSMNTARGTMGYIAPEVFSRNFGNVSYKSDVYSFGMLVLEMVGGRKSTNVTKENVDEVYYPEWIYNLLEGGEDFRILINENEDNAKIAKELAIVGLWCIQWHPISRPTMKHVVHMLEGEEELAMPPNPFASISSSSTTRKTNLLTRRVALELEAIAE